MHKEWLWISVACVLLEACATQPPAPQVQVQQAYTGSVEEISGAEPRYEPFHPNVNQDYKANGQSYRIVKDPQNFSQTGLATTYSEETTRNITAIGERFDSNDLAAAHPTLPIPSYVRVTNVSNGRKLVVRVNDRGPYTQSRIIALSTAAADRLNISNNTKVKIDFITVAPDGSLSGPGMIGTTIAKQTYALPDRPNLTPSTLKQADLKNTLPAAASTYPVSNDNLVTIGNTQSVAPQSDSFLRSSSASLPVGINKNSEPLAATGANSDSVLPVTTTPAIVTGRYRVQVGALSDNARAQSLQQSLSERFGVPGKIATSENVHRVQLGPFENKQQAAELQQRLLNEAQQQSFIITDL